MNKRYSYKVYNTPSNLHLFTAVFAPVKTIDVVYNRDLKVRAKRNIHVKMPTMCRVQFNRRG